MNVGSIEMKSVIQQTQSIQYTPKTTTPEPQPGNQSLTESIQKTLGVENGAKIDEEQFQHGLTKHVLDEVNPEAAASYMKGFQEAQQNGMSVEDAVKAGLKQAVSDGHLTQQEAEAINGVTFRAAQLDDNLSALYDGKGGPNDPTIATASLDEAVAKATQVFEQAQSGSLPLEARSLDAPSNVAPSAAASSSGINGGGGSGEFLWKPVSESDGNLVVLLPSEYTGKIVSAGVYSSLPPTPYSRIDEGRFAGDANGGRAHFRFPKSGGSYPDGSYVVAQLNDGRNVSFQIPETSARTTK